MNFSHMIAYEADQYTDTEFLSVMSNVITMETTFVLEASYSISGLLTKIWKLISGIFKFVYKILASAINFIKVKILGKRETRQVTQRPVSQDKDGLSVTNQVTGAASAFMSRDDVVKVPIDSDILEKEYLDHFVHNIKETDFLCDIAYGTGLYASRLDHLESWFNLDHDISHLDFNKHCEKFRTPKHILEYTPDKIIYTESIRECEIKKSEVYDYWSTIYCTLSNIQTGFFKRIDEDVSNMEKQVESNKDRISLLTEKYPGVLDDFLKTVNIIPRYLNQVKNVIAEISKVVMSNTNIFKQ